jgi:Fe-S-cluster containining protein
MSEADAFKRSILENSPRLTPASRFKFGCHPGVTCFNRCCADVNIVLTPYDVLRLRRRLGLGSTEFIVQHTVRPFTKEQKLPLVLLRMRDDEKHTCPFVTEQGCGVYTDRPWACRMYPVGAASSHPRAAAGEDFYFLLEEDHCHGHREDTEWTVAGWMENQGVGEYDAQGELFKEVTLHPRLLEGPALDPRKMDLFFMACYDLDRFRRFVFESRFLSTFDLAEEHVAAMRSDDEALLKFGLEWLRFALFAEPSVKVNPKVLEAKRQELQQQRSK